jgi:hypothetical protein
MATKVVRPESQILFLYTLSLQVVISPQKPFFFRAQAKQTGPLNHRLSTITM